MTSKSKSKKKFEKKKNNLNLIKQRIESVFNKRIMFLVDNSYSFYPQNCLPKAHRISRRRSKTVRFDQPDKQGRGHSGEKGHT